MEQNSEQTMEEIANILSERFNKHHIQIIIEFQQEARKTDVVEAMLRMLVKASCEAYRMGVGDTISRMEGELVMLSAARKGE